MIPISISLKVHKVENSRWKKKKEDINQIFDQIFLNTVNRLTEKIGNEILS